MLFDEATLIFLRWMSRSNLVTHNAQPHNNLVQQWIEVSNYIFNGN